ncbi:MAG: 4a-hydroxytetrahydrobiopterin dehydratase [Pirellulales bacterium]
MELLQCMFANGHAINFHSGGAVLLARIAANDRGNLGGIIMQSQTAEQLVAKKCKPCEGGVDACTLDEANDQLSKLTGWYLTHDGQRIRKDWTVKNFMAGMAFFNRVAELAEADGHHPDVHLWGYRNAWIELWTHAIGGLSENDFILAAKIDLLPVEGKK